MASKKLERPAQMLLPSKTEENLSLLFQLLDVVIVLGCLFPVFVWKFWNWVDYFAARFRAANC